MLLERDIQPEDPRYGYFIGLQPIENIKHLFWQCETSKMVIQTFFKWILNLNWLRGQEEIEELDFMLGFTITSKILLSFDLIWKHFVKFYIYKCRQRKAIPSFPSAKFEFEGVMDRKKYIDWNSLRFRLQGIYADKYDWI